MKEIETRMLIQEFHPFYSCCWHAAQDVIELDADLNQLMEETKNRDMTSEEGKLSLDMQHVLHMKEITAPVFAVAAAENFIHYYGITTLNEKHLHSIEHLDKLDTYSKWIIIPALSCGNEINKASSAMNDLNQLIKIRNLIIHPKPKILNNYTDSQADSAITRVESMKHERRRIAKKSPEIFINLIQELLLVDSSEKLRDIISKMALPVPGIEPFRIAHENT